MNDKKNSIRHFFESGNCSQAIRKGLIFMTPLVILSSLTQVALHFPVASYQEWLTGPAAGFFFQLLTRIYSATLDHFSLLLSFSVAWCYAEQLKIKSGKSFVSPAAGFFFQLLTRIYSATLDHFSLLLSFSVAWCYAEQLKIKSGKSFVSFGATASFMLLIGLGSGQFNPEYFGTAGIFSSLLAALITTKLFHILSQCPLFRLKNEDSDSFLSKMAASIFPLGCIFSSLLAALITTKLFHILSQCPLFRLKNEDSDSFLSKMAASIFPLGCILVLFATFSLVLDELFHVCLQDLIENFLTLIFLRLRTSRLLTGVFYTVTLHLLWFFGIHGSHVYFEINEVFLNNLLQRNIDVAAAGGTPVEIVNTVSLNMYCNLGGAGATLALVIAILLVSKRKNIRRVAKFAAVPSLFNVNEIILFGLPVVFNPGLFLPFVVTPFVNLCIGYAATAMNLVPVISTDVNWTTPPFFSGYVATGSLSGTFLQAFLLAVDVVIYLPFVKQLDKKIALFTDLYEDDFEKIKTMEEKDSESRRLIHALSNLYEDVFEANMETRTIRIIRTSIKDNGFFDEQEISFSKFKAWTMKKVLTEERGAFDNLLSSEEFVDRLIQNNILEKEVKIEKNGMQQWIRIQFIASEMKNGRLSVVTITVMNIDAMKQMQEEHNMALWSAYQAARQASMAKSAFLSNMSHDIRTPMNAIMGMCTIAGQHMDDSKRVQDCLNKIGASSTHMLNLINAVLDMSKIENGKMVLQEQPIRLGQIMKEICDIVQPQALKKQIHFAHSFEELKDICVIGDKLRIRQIFVNILENAFKFTPDGGTVVFEAHRVSPVYADYVTLEFTCSDTGVGMSEEFKRKLFQPFERDERQEINETEGSGLGMAIVKNIVDMMNGEIYADSRLNEGTKFTVVLHLKDTKGKAFSGNETKNQSGEMDGRLKGKRILLAEDNELNREIAIEFLAVTGAEIKEAVNGKEAVKLFASSPAGYYDIVFMDIQMPEMNGYEAAKTIRQLERPDSGLPIIAMTANAFSEDIRMTKEAGMNEHISKPIDVQKLYQVLEQFLKA